MSTIKLINVPWRMDHPALYKALSRAIPCPLRSVNIIYSKETGLSRGRARVRLSKDSVATDLLRSGMMQIGGRDVLIVREKAGEQGMKRQVGSN